MGAVYLFLYFSVHDLVEGALRVVDDGTILLWTLGLYIHCLYDTEELVWKIKDSWMNLLNDFALTLLQCSSKIIMMVLLHSYWWFTMLVLLI